MKRSKKILVWVGIAVPVISCIYGVLSYYKQSPAVPEQTIENSLGDNSSSYTFGGDVEKVEIIHGGATEKDEEATVDKPSSKIPSGLRLLKTSKILGSFGGFTPKDDQNPLLIAKVCSITGVTTEADYVAYPNQGFMATAVMQRLVDSSDPVIHSCKLVVSDFKEIPPFVPAYGGIEMLDAIEATFLVKKRDSNLPWEFPATHYRIYKGDAVGEVELPFIDADAFAGALINDSSPQLLRVHFSSSEPGIYWVNFFLEVSDGAHEESTESLPMFSEPIPVAYFDPDKPENAEPRLDEVSASDHWVSFPSCN